MNNRLKLNTDSYQEIGFPFTAPKNGFIYVVSALTSQNAFLHINGKNFANIFGRGGYCQGTVSSFVSKGDVITLSGSSTQNRWFIPLV